MLPPKAWTHWKAQDPFDFIKLYFISLWEEIKQGRGLLFPLTAWLGYSLLGIIILELLKGAEKCQPQSCSSQTPSCFDGTNLISGVCTPKRLESGPPIIPLVLQETELAVPRPKHRRLGLSSKVDTLSYNQPVRTDFMQMHILLFFWGKSLGLFLELYH